MKTEAVEASAVEQQAAEQLLLSSDESEREDTSYDESEPDVKIQVTLS